MAQPASYWFISLLGLGSGLLMSAVRWKELGRALAPVLSVGLIALAMRLVPALAEHPLVPLSFAFIVSAWLGGLLGGLLATLLGALAAQYFMAPTWQFVAENPLPVVVYIFAGVASSLLFEALHAARRRLELLLSESEAHRAELAESQAHLRRAHADVNRISQQLLVIANTRRERAEGALRSTEEQLRHAQRMEAVGRLAGGIAHDFNNLLTIILSYADLMLRRVRDDERQRRDLEEILGASRRAAELTQQLLAFSRKQVLQPRVVDLNEIVAGARGMIERLIGEDVRLALQLAPSLSTVECDPGQIVQVILNLAANARDAMPKGGELTISTGESPADAHSVMLTVTDIGTGMDEPTRAHIFEPFFTTKPRGKGTGLGLSTVYGIVEQSRGTITVESAPGKGTTFRILLPHAKSDEVAKVERARPASRRGCETILLVEDEAQVRTLIHEILVNEGYVVLPAQNGSEALDRSAGHVDVIDLLISDVVMPVMSGGELVAKLAPQRPDMRVLFISGYTDDVIGQHGVLRDDIAFLQKPLTPESLLHAVRQVLEAPQGCYRVAAFA